MKPLFKVGDYVVVLDGEKIGDPHRVGWGGSMKGFVGSVGVITECRDSMLERTPVYRIQQDPNHVYDEIWLCKVDEDELKNNDIDDFLSEYEVR